MYVPTGARGSPPFVEGYGTGGVFRNAMRIFPSLGIAAMGMTNATRRWHVDDVFTAIAAVVMEERAR